MLTHDVATMRAFAAERVRASEPMPRGDVARTVARRSAIENILFRATCRVNGEWEGSVSDLP